MRLGICHHVTLPGTWADAIAAASTLGVEGIELFVRADDLAELDDPSIVRQARETARKARLEISSLCLAFLMHVEARLSDPARRGMAVGQATAGIRRCAEAGGDMVLIPAFSAQDEPTMDALVASIRDLVPVAADLGVRIGVESNLPAAEVLAMLDRIGSPSVVGDYFDMGNAAGRGMDPADEIRLRGSRVARVHVKGSRGGALDGGTVDLAAVREALRATGYDGWMLLETSAGDDALANARHNLAVMRASFPA